MERTPLLVPLLLLCLGVGVGGSRGVLDDGRSSRGATLGISLASNNDNEVATMLARTLAKMLPASTQSVQILDKAVNGYAPLLNRTSGRFTDIIYESVGSSDRSWWPVAVHLQRALIFGIATLEPRSAYHQSATLRSTMELVLSTWIESDVDNVPAFHNSNWWWEEIGLPRAVGKCLVLLSSWQNVSGLKEWVDKSAPILARAHYTSQGEGTAANQVWRASAHSLWALVSGNTTMLREAYDVMQAAVVVHDHGSREDGIQHDFSFHQHGAQLYTGWGYGAIFTTTVLDMDQVAHNTTYQMSDVKMDIFSEYVLHGQLLTTRGANFDYTACGRLMTYFSDHDQYGLNSGHYHYFAAFTPYENAFPEFRSPFNTPLAVDFQNLLPSVTARNQSILDQFVAFQQRLNGNPEMDSLSVHKHFYTSDYSVHHRPGWAVTVRMYSTRTLNTECGNDEGKQGKTVADGVTNVYVNGSEYENTYPAWNWSLVPGTTEHQRGFPFTCSEATKVNHTEFVGGTSDDNLGVSCMNFSRSGISVHKAWAFADEFVLHMGSGSIIFTEHYSIATSLDQKELRSNVSVGIASGHQDVITLSRGDHILENVAWIHHNDVLYITQDNSKTSDCNVIGKSCVSEGATVGIFNTQRNGTWADITQGSNATLMVDMFGVFYPQLPADSTDPFQYMYTVMPNTKLAEVPTRLQTLASTLLQVTNTRDIQSACMKTDDGFSLQAVFWNHTGGTTSAGDLCWQLSSSMPCIAMLNTRITHRSAMLPQSTFATFSVSNPLQSAAHGSEADDDADDDTDDFCIDFGVNTYSAAF
eukprot:scpid36485/ scgid13305/ Chondroitinase-AC; Chondroitin sulfate AC lyase; Chondroitin-AC eliminase; Chondroitin-AC lyase